jgi:hypothetical protein
MKRVVSRLAGVALAALLVSASAGAEEAKVKAEPYVWATAPMGGGGFVDGFVYHPTEKGLMYARTDVGGAYRWDAANRSWIPLLDGMSRNDDFGVLSLALDARDPDKVYIATGLYTGQWASTATVWRSGDRGATWQKADLAVKLGGNEDGRGTGERLAVDPNSGDILFLGSSNDGLLRSADGAKTWSSVGSFPEKHINFVLFDPRSGSRGSASKTIYVGVNSPDHNLYVSHDGGGTWAPMPGTPRGFVAHHADFDASGVALYVTFADQSGPNNCKNGAVSRYDMAAGTWGDITPQKPGNGGPAFCYAGLSAAAGKPGTLVVTTLDRWWGGDTMFRSTDAGRHWTDLRALSKHESPYFPWIMANRPADAMGHWMSDVKINPLDANEAVYGTGDGLWMTENLSDADAQKPVLWSFELDNFEETAALDLISPSAGAHLIAAVGDVGGFRFLNFEGSPPLDGGYFSPPAGTNRAIDFAERNPGLVVRMADGDAAKQHALISLDNGKTWADMPSSPPMVLHDDKGWYSPGRIAVSANGTAMLWATGKGEAYHSPDRGKSWIKSEGYPIVQGRSFPVFSDRAADGVFYVYDTSAGEMSISADGGATFKVFARGLPVLESWRGAGMPRAVPGRPRDIWLPTPQGLGHSPDMKSPFSLITGFSEATAVGFGKAADGQTYPAVYAWGRYKGIWGIFRSIDEGKTWVRINDDAHQYGGGGEVIGDPRQFGLVYITTAGRGVALGQPAGDLKTDEKEASPAK